MARSRYHHPYLYTGRRPRSLSLGVGRLHQAHVGDHLHEAGILPGAVNWSVLAVAADDGPHSFRDERYYDRDGNRTADLPTDPAEWLDPDTIILSYTPVEDPAVYQSVWDGFSKHMSEITGKKVAFFPVQSNAAQLEALRSGRLQDRKSTRLNSSH